MPELTPRSRHPGKPLSQVPPEHLVSFKFVFLKAHVEAWHTTHAPTLSPFPLWHWLPPSILWNVLILCIVVFPRQYVGFFFFFLSQICSGWGPAPTWDLKKTFEEPMTESWSQVTCAIRSMDHRHITFSKHIPAKKIFVDIHKIYTSYEGPRCCANNMIQQCCHSGGLWHLEWEQKHECLFCSDRYAFWNSCSSKSQLCNSLLNPFFVPANT